jgi:uncharacterized integral membrane protein
MKRLLKVFALAVIGGIVAAFAIANRQPVRFIVDPFINRDLAFSIDVPLYILLFIALFTGLFLGAAAVWIGQGRWRKAARSRSKEAALWKREAANLKAGIQSTAGGAAVSAAPRQLRSYP